MKYYLGIANTFHDSSLALVNPQGEILFAEANERYLQFKRAVNSSPEPFLRIESLLKHYLEPNAELCVAYTWSQAYQETINPLLNQSDFLDFQRYIQSTPSNEIPEQLKDHYYSSRFFIQSALAAGQLSGLNLEFGLSQLNKTEQIQITDIRTYDHHLTHAASACYSSGLSTAACAILDGYGEGLAYQSYIFQDNTLAPISNNLPKYSAQSASLGSFYMQICKLCGFGLFHGEEWKVMGLASYGKLDLKLYALLSSLIRVEGLDLVQADMPTSMAIYHELANYRHQQGQSYLNVADLAFTAQQLFSERVYEYLRALHASTQLDSVILGGGCLLNSSTNGKITEHTPFKHAYVFSAPGDDGNSIGAALLAYYQDHPNNNTTRPVQSPYLGSSVSVKQLQTLQQFSPNALTVDHNTIAKLAANYLTQGKIIGWMQGRAEFGPRALGNRSILADPRSESVKDRINAEIKFREAFRPFAPSILSDYGQEYFDNFQDSPYMERTLRFKPSVIAKIPGVVHIDGTGRLQTVKQEWNPLFYDLIAEFYRLTGIPLVLNTSFNVMGKPIIHSIEDALAVFYTSGLDVLIIENIVIEKYKS